jgi:hypothetical protein
MARVFITGSRRRAGSGSCSDLSAIMTPSPSPTFLTTRVPPAFALAVSEAGGATVRTVVLLTPEEVDAAAKHSVEYRPPMEWEARHF